jgi:hypothetical protein
MLENQSYKILAFGGNFKVEALSSFIHNKLDEILMKIEIGTWNLTFIEGLLE